VRLTDSFLSALKKGKIGIDACVRARARQLLRARSSQACAAPCLPDPPPLRPLLSRAPCRSVSSLSASQIFEELPLRIRNSALVSAALFDLTSRRALGAAAAPAAGAVGASAALAPAPSADVDFARLDLNSGPFLEKHLELLKDVTEQLLRAQQESSYYQRRLDANARARAEWLARRREENELRRRNKEPLLPEEDPSLPFFRAVDPPRGAKDPLDVALMSANISHYCAQVGKFSGASFGKLFLASSLHKQ
jgi:translation initiation factor 3 subunit H